MKLEIKDGGFVITRGGEIIADNVKIFKKYYDGSAISIAEPEGEWTKQGNSFICDNYTVEYSDIAENAITVKAEYRNTLDCTVGYSPFVVLSGKLKFRADVCLFTKPDMEEFYASPTMLSLPDTCKLMDGNIAEGADVVAFTKRGGRNAEGAVIGFAEYETYPNSIKVNGNGYFEAYHCLDDGFHLAPGKSVKSDAVYFAITPDIREGLPEFAERIGKMNGVTGEWPETPFGWCSWYYYLPDITPDEIRVNIESLKEYKEQLPIKYIQIDDGWQKCIGQWEGNTDKGFDMKKMADEIRAAGYTPGLWFCPTWIGKFCDIVHNHTDWLVKARGSEDAAVFRSLDVTIPEVEQYIRDLMHRITYDWGYKYIKYDFMKSAITDGDRRDKSVTPLAAYRKVLRILRESAAPGTFILNCTAPLIPSVGLCDAMRVSVDIGNDWEAVKDVAVRTIKRWYMHRNLYINDADCMLSRKSENEDELCNRRCIRNDDELKTFATVMAASGGIIMLSDKMPLLGEEQIGLLKKLYPLNTRAAVPLDIAQRVEPAILDFGTNNGIRSIAVINWEDTTESFSVPLDRKYNAYEFWTREHYGVLDSLELTVEPHCTKLVFLCDCDRTLEGDVFEHITPVN